MIDGQTFLFYLGNLLSDTGIALFALYVWLESKYTTERVGVTMGGIRRHISYPPGLLGCIAKNMEYLILFLFLTGILLQLLSLFCYQRLYNILLDMIENGPFQLLIPLISAAHRPFPF